MPTMIVFAMIVGIFTLFQYIFDFYRGQKSDYLVLVNTAIFVVASIGVALFGIKYEGIELSTYSAGHIYAFGLLIGGTMLLYALAHLLKGKNAHYYPGSLLVLGILFFASLAFAAPVFFSQVASNLAAFFGQAPVTTTIQEARAWGILEAWVAFSYGLILMIGGVIVLLARNIRDEQPHQIFVLIWSLIMLVSAWQHVRYEYYLAVNIALLSAVCLSSAWDIGARTTLEKARTLISTETGKSEGSTGKVPEKRGKIAKTEAKPGKKHKSVSRRSALPPIILCIGVTILSLLFIYSSVSHSMLSANYAIRMNDDWKESLEWMGSHTPDTGVDYYKIYDEKTYKYPPNAYGVMSWWDYGHMITYIAKRIPNANPFQRGVAGPIGAATYFMLPSEEAANAILDTLTTRYVITDIEMDAGKFWAMATWYNTTAGTEPYMNLYAIPDQNDPLRYNKAEGYDQNYYLTMVSRLHNFDGSMVEPTRVFYIQYQETPLGSTIIPVITQAVPMNALEAKAAVESFNANAKRGEHADILSTTVFFPKETVPALKHYRLVHESPTDVVNDKSLDVRYVKVFEYVKGARIKGNGIIEVPVVTNTGRTFTYRQASENGEFIVPYSTSGSDSEVRATGKYRIVGATTQYEAPEDAVREGRTIN
jgi:dolichyl-diphosphooligosaccharide--protein glycosyltransferase